MLLKNCSSISLGYSFRSSIVEKNNSGVHVIQLKDVSIEQGISWNNTIETELESKKEPEWLKVGDILFAGRGTRNYAFLVDKHHCKALASPHFFIIRLHQKNILPEFIVWQLNQKPCQKFFEKESEGTQAKSIRRAVLENTSLIIPSLIEQEKIIHIDALAKKQLAIYEQLKTNNESLMTSLINQLHKRENY